MATQSAALGSTRPSRALGRCSGRASRCACAGCNGVALALQAYMVQHERHLTKLHVSHVLFMSPSATFTVQRGKVPTRCNQIVESGCHGPPGQERVVQRFWDDFPRQIFHDAVDSSKRHPPKAMEPKALNQRIRWSAKSGFVGELRTPTKLSEQQIAQLYSSLEAPLHII